jgi:hypothetical protein
MEEYTMAIQHVSPGVFTSIIDLTSYVRQVPSTIGMTCAITPKGRDNQLVFISSPTDYVNEFGTPDYLRYPRKFSQGMYIPYNFLSESGAFYFMRPLPLDAQYANIAIIAQYSPDSTQARPTIVCVYDTTATSMLDMETFILRGESGTFPICMLYPIGRGDYYNQISVHLSAYANPMLSDVYVLDIYQKQETGKDEIVESFDVSFDPNKISSSGDSLYIVYVLATYSNILRAVMSDSDGNMSEGYQLANKVFSRNMAEPVVLGVRPSDATNAWLIDYKQDMSRWQKNPETTTTYTTLNTPPLNPDVGDTYVVGSSPTGIWSGHSGDLATSDGTSWAFMSTLGALPPGYAVIATDAFGTRIYGWLGAADPNDNTKIHVFKDRFLTNGAGRGWCGIAATDVDATAALNNFDATSEGITFEIKKTYSVMTDAFYGLNPVTGRYDIAVPPKPLRYGSDGDIKNNDGSINETNANLVLEGAFTGGLTNPMTGKLEDTMFDTDNYYFNVVYDAGYDTLVKQCISRLAIARGDCISILDNGDNRTPDEAVRARRVVKFNNYYTALYEEYSKVNDIFTGQPEWFSPCYHMAYLVPRNDSLGALWTAIAGFNRTTIENIQALRYSPNLNQRDQMYLAQLNPIVSFPQGYVVWGQLTSQTKPSKMENINVIRLVLYIKRALEAYCMYYVFENNDSNTWAKVANDVSNFLEDIKTRRGLNSYNVEVGATQYEQQSKKFHVNVTLNPTTPAEQILLNLFIV